MFCALRTDLTDLHMQPKTVAKSRHAKRLNVKNIQKTPDVGSRMLTCF